MPKFNLTLDASQIYEYQTCPLKWYYHYKENLEVIGLQSEPLDKGTLVHKLLEIFYMHRALNPNSNIFESSQFAIDEFKSLEYTKRRGYEKELETFLVDRFNNYVVRYSFDDFNVANINNTPGVELGFSKLLYENNEVRFIVEGKIDLVNIINGNILAFTDHKTQDRVNYLYQYKPQFKTYAWATGYEWGMINYFGLQKDYKAGVTFRRELINFPKWMIDEWEAKMINIFWNIYFGLEDDYAKKNPERIFYNSRNESSCGGAFESHPCQFAHICETNWDFKQQVKSFKYTQKEPWKPWELAEVNKQES